MTRGGSGFVSEKDRPRVLVAETLIPLRRLLSSVLRDCGYRVVEISTCGQMARELQVAREAESPIRLVVADRDLADGSAITALEEARVIGWGGPAILILPFAGRAELEEARAFPDALVLDLPFDPDQLQAWAQGLVPLSDRRQS